VIVTAPSRQARQEIERNSAARQARACYDHLAGVAGVSLLESLVQRGWLVARARADGRPAYELTVMGEIALRDRGVDVPAARRARRGFALACMDWTERRPHLGGALGAALLRALGGTSGARPSPSRAVRLAIGIDAWIAGPRVAERRRPR
jgi:hypothetical protein